MLQAWAARLMAAWTSSRVMKLSFAEATKSFGNALMKMQSPAQATGTGGPLGLTAQENQRPFAGLEARHPVHDHRQVVDGAARLHDLEMTARRGRPFPGLDEREVDRGQDLFVARVPRRLRRHDVDHRHVR